MIPYSTVGRIIAELRLIELNLTDDPPKTFELYILKRLSFKYAQIYWGNANKLFDDNDIKSNLKNDLGIDTTENIFGRLWSKIWT